MKRLLCVLLVIIFTVSCFSSQAAIVKRFSNQKYIPFEPKLPPMRPMRWFVGLGFGSDMLFFRDRTISLLNNVAGNPNDTFTMMRASKHTELERVLFGFRRKFVGELVHYFTLQFEYDHMHPVKVNGTRVAIGDPAFTSDYTYNVSRHVFLVSGKVNLIKDWRTVMPYFAVGVGVSRNCFSSFHNPAVLTMPAFPNRSTYEFSYVIGLGIDWETTKNLLLSLGYRFASWGDILSGKVSTVSSGAAIAPIRLKHALYSHQIMITLHYFFMKQDVG